MCSWLALDDSRLCLSKHRCRQQIELARSMVRDVACSIHSSLLDKSCPKFGERFLRCAMRFCSHDLCSVTMHNVRISVCLARVNTSAPCYWYTIPVTSRRNHPRSYSARSTARLNPGNEAAEFTTSCCPFVQCQCIKLRRPYLFRAVPYCVPYSMVRSTVPPGPVVRSTVRHGFLSESTLVRHAGRTYYVSYRTPYRIRR